MHFTLKNVQNASGRLGVLTGFARAPNTSIETPACAFLTQGGSVVHLTAEVLSKVITDSHLLWMPLCNSVQLQKGVKAQGNGVASFAGLPNHVFCVTLNNMNEATPAGHLEADQVPLWTKQGKKLIDAEKYMDVMETFQPDMILAIADSKISLNEGAKRICKSVARTCGMLDKCVNRYKASKELRYSSLVGVIVGASDSKRCEECIKRVLSHKDSLTGVALSGLTDGSEESYSVKEETLVEIFKRVGSAIPEDLLRLVEGSWNPSVIVSAIELGWDVFDGSYAVKLSNNGNALVLDYDICDYKEQMCILDLGDISYQDDLSPIQEGCTCLTCTKHKRAYIRHLLNTREMLASVLLSIHNLHNFNQLFHHARNHIAANTFPEFKNHIKKQYEYYTKKQTTIITEQESELKSLIEMQAKKKRVSDDFPNGIANGNWLTF